MDFINFIILTVIAGISFYLIDTYVTLAPVFRAIMRVSAVVVVIYLILGLFGLVALPHLIK